MKKSFIKLQKWKGQLPLVFDKFVSHVFDLNNDQEVNPANLLNELFKINFNFYQFDYGIGEIEWI